jgi:hypothetical protein
MSTVLTGSAADPTTSPQATCPADTDTGNAASVNGAYQSILNFISWLRTNGALRNMAGGKITNQGTPSSSGDGAVYPVSRSQMAAVGQQVSNSSGTYSTTSDTYADVTNLSVTITTSGRPVILMLVPDGSGNQSSFAVTNSSVAGTFLALRAYRGASVIADVSAVTQAAASASLCYVHGSWMMMDTPAAGTYTYKLQAAVSIITTTTGYMRYLKLVAFEL